MSRRRKRQKKNNKTRTGRRKVFQETVKAAGVSPAGLNDDTASQDASGFKLFIPERVFEKVMYWIKKASPSEVSGMGTLMFDDETRTFLVRDAYLLKQEVSMGSAEIDEHALNFETYKRRDEDGALKWHWHSHPTFGVNWSGTDMNLIRQLGQPGWIVATVINNKRESRTAFLQSVDLMGKPHDIFIDDFPLEILRPAFAEDMAALDAEFDLKVNKKTYFKHSSFVTRGHDGVEKEFNTNLDNDPRYEKIGRVYYPKALLPAGTSIERIPASAYDEYGFTKVNGVFVYNPLQDKEVNSDELLYAMIADMTAEEIAYLKERDPDFTAVMIDYAADMRMQNSFNEGGVEV